MHRNKIICLVLAFAVLLSLSTFLPQAAALEEADEWSQFQKDGQNSGFSEIALSQSHDIFARSGNIQAREGSQPVISGNKAFVYTGVDDTSGSIYCFDLSSNKKLWEKEIDPPTYLNWSSPAVCEGVIYIGSGSSVHALNSQSGKILWKKNLGEFKKGALIVNSSPTVDEENLFIGDWANGIYYSLDRKTGELNWGFELGEGCNAPSTPAISGNRVFVCQSAAYGAPISPNGGVWCLDKETGKPLTSWGNNGFYQTDGELDVTGSVCAGEGKIYFADFKFGAMEEPQNHLYCLNGQTGKGIWKKEVYPSSGTPAVVGETVFLSCQQMAKDGNINWTCAFRENGETGEVSKIWEKKGVGGFNVSPAIARDKLLVAKTKTDPSSWMEVGSGICALDCETGDTFWETNEGGSSIPTPYGVISITKGEMLLFGEGGERKSDYYFAEGTTREGFQEWICLENPNAKLLNVTINYMTNSSPIEPQPVILPPTSRVTIDVNLYVGANCDVAARVTGDGYFVAERAMYFKNWGLDGGDQVMGLASPRNEYFFAEGTTRGGFQTWLAIGNPANEPVNLLVNYFYGGGEPPKGENYELEPNSRMTIDVNTQAGAEKDVSIALRSNGGLCAERIMYFKTPFD
ncbi:MAG: PQQ-binding-like beta-propeller repeat protein, partial [Actinomycetota bacterium]|nr:PQQ-binding-like beta-propeller repeat protein [Actinomycetota bacterium]